MSLNAVESFAVSTAITYPELAILRLLGKTAEAAVPTLIAATPDATYSAYEAADEAIGPDAHLAKNVIVLARALVDAIAAYDNYVTRRCPADDPYTDDEIPF